MRFGMRRGRGPGYKAFRYGGMKVHLRMEPSGIGVLVVGAKRSAYLNRTAAFYAEAFLRGMSPDEAARLATKRFRGVDQEKAREDFLRTSERLKAFLEGEEVCPITDLGFERVDPGSLRTSAPFRFDLALTYACNNRCVHCYSSSPADGREMGTRGWFGVLDRVAEIGTPNVVFTGGEPTLRPDLPDLVRRGESLGLVTGLVTNGRRLADRRLAEELVDAGLDYAQVTLESHRREVHERITGVPGSWEETVQGIRNLAELGIYVDVNATLSTLNVGDVGGLARLAADLGADAVSLNRLIYSGRGIEVRGWFEPDPGRTAEAVEEMMVEAADLDLEFRWYGVTRYCEFNPLAADAGLKFCSACSITLAVEPDGTAIPCQSYFHPLGNLLRDRWEDIWDHPKCAELRERRYAGEACRDCPLFPACGGGCPLEAEVKPYPPSSPIQGDELTAKRL